MSTASKQSRFADAPGTRRWIGLFVVSVLLHLLVLGQVSGKLGIPSSTEPAPAAITAQLHPAPQSAPAVVPKPKAMPPKRPPKPKPQLKPRPSPVDSAVPTIADQGNAAPAQAQPVDLNQLSEAFQALENAAAPEEPAIAEAATTTPDDIAEPAQIDQPHYKVSIPPPAELKYDVQALRDGQMVYGSGKISWAADGDKYTVTGEASILFFTLLSFQSAGMIDASGVAPVMYSEKRFRRPETATHFHRERNIISFSASTVTYPRKGGEQDRASIVWQLTSIGRGDSEKFKPGAELELFVAGVRDGASWRIRVIGEENIDIDGEKITAWHVVRVPKQGSYDQTLDIWFSPKHEWYPVKLRFTEANGEYLDMLLSNVTPVATN